MVGYATYQKINVKAKRVILDAIKDDLIPHVARKAKAFEMLTSLTNLYQSSNENIKMVLREKLKSVRMGKGEGMASYLTKITQVRDELAAVGEVVGIPQMVHTTLNGVS